MPVVFVAKSSVKSWPIFGLMARFTNTIFLDRSSKTSMLRAYQQIKETLNDSSIFIFPEGTSTVGKHVEPFHSNFFQIPVDLKNRLTQFLSNILKIINLQIFQHMLVMTPWLNQF